MSKDDKKRDHTPAENVAAKKVAAETETVAVATEAKPVTSRRQLSKGAIIGLSAAGVAVILGAGFTGAAIANADHGPRGAEHSQIDGPQGQRDGKRGHDGGQLPGQNGPQGQLPGQQGQFVDPDPNDNDGPGTGVAPQGPAPKPGIQGSAPAAPGAPQALGQGAPQGFTRGS
jgi:hypothetical protein